TKMNELHRELRSIADGEMKAVLAPTDADDSTSNQLSLAADIISMLPGYQNTEASSQKRAFPVYTMEYFREIREREAAWDRRMAEEKRKRKALSRLLRAIDCVDRPGRHGKQFCLRFCRPEMKEIVRHMRVCTSGKDCEYPKCKETTTLKEHWDECNRKMNSMCSICGTMMAKIAYINRNRALHHRPPPPPRAA
ncbi:hypothetical protein PMAYCL1PPCAC_01075, partial [Pristionchus mayeri]